MKERGKKRDKARERRIRDKEKIGRKENRD
jgi:hypothetical protein